MDIKFTVQGMLIYATMAAYLLGFATCETTSVGRLAIGGLATGAVYVTGSFLIIRKYGGPSVMDLIPARYKDKILARQA